MAARGRIYFDDPPPEDQTVTFAVAPTDAFTGRIVSAGVEVRIRGLPQRPIRSLSGIQVFVVDWSPGRRYEVLVHAVGAGYFDPDLVDFPAPDPTDEAVPSLARRLTIHLLRRPSFPYMDGETLVSGVVVRGGAAVASADIWADLPEQPVPDNPPGESQFRTLTDERGAFALAMRLPAPTPDPDEVHANVANDAVLVKLHIRDGADHFNFYRSVTEGRRHVFSKPIDLDIAFVEPTHDPFPHFVTTAENVRGHSG